jgi:PAS domain S-box-containing protein
MHALDNIFSEFDGQSEELHRLLTALKERLPDGRFQLVSDQGENIPSEEPLFLPDETRKSLVGKAKESDSLVQDELPGDIQAYAIPINKLNAVLLFVLPEQLFDPAAKYYGAATVRLCVDLFLSQKAVHDEQQFAITQKKQLNRKIHVLENQYQEILEDNRQQYRHIIDNIEDVYFEVDMAVNLTFFNNALAQTLGYTRDELTGMNYQNIMNQKEAKRIFKIYKTAYKTETPVKRTGMAIKTNDGTEKYFNVSISLMKNEGHQTIGFRCIARDMTEQKYAEDALRESEEKFRGIGTSANDAIIIMDNEGCISYWNEASEKIFGYANQEVLGKDLHSFLVSQHFDKAFRKAFGNFKKTGQGNAIDKTVELTALKKDGTEIPVELSLSSIKLKNNWSAVGIVRDITKRKSAEEELKSTNRQLEQAIGKANELAVQAEMANMAKSEFLANMSHEIRTPMNAVLGFTDMLFDTRLDENQTDYVTTVKRSGEALLSLINDILDFSKIEAGQLDFEEVDFDPELVAYDVCEMIRPKIESKPIEILCHIGDNIPSRIKGDPLRFRQALTNLMGNASKFTESGEIELSLDIEEEERDRLKLHAKVRDTGISIPKDKLFTIFTPFQQADGSNTRKYGGTGLGLSICKQISQLMNGDVWAESEGKGKGSIFHFTGWLRKTEDKKARRYKPAILSGRKILIVDDNRNNLDILRHTLKLGGMTVVVLTRGQDVIPTLQQAAEEKNSFDLCICDIRMPGMNGHEVAKEIRNSELKIKNLPLIALSSLMARDSKKCEDVGFNGFLNKPIRREKLFQMMERILSEEDNTIENSKLKIQNSIATQYSVREDMKHSVHILLAEDNPVNQRLAKLMLTKAGYQVEVTGNGKEAVKKYTASPEDFDLILMDIQMPEMDGMQATEEIRKWESQKKNGDKFKIQNSKLRIPIVAMTAHAMQGDREKCLDAGMDDYMTKPIKRELVFETLHKWVLS